jgi:hypothetical protein
MWISRDAYQQLVTQAAQCDLLSAALAKAETRAETAEAALIAERARVDKLNLAVMDYGATKSGSIAISSRVEPPPKVEPHPKGYLHEPDEVELAKLEWYKQKCREAGRNEDEATAYWEAEMRGEHPALLGAAMDSEAEQ